MHLGQWFHLHTVRKCAFSLLSAIYHCCVSSCLHFISVYIFFFSSSCARHLFRTYVSAVSNERAQMRYVVLAMSHKETGSAALSYRCSHKHRRLNERSSTILLHANPIVLGEESVSNSMTRSPTSVAAPTSSLSALLAVCRSARWRLAVEGRRGLAVVLNPLCGSAKQPYVNLASLLDSSPPFFMARHGALKAPRYDVTNGADASQTLQSKQNLKTKIIDSSLNQLTHIHF